MKPRFIQANQTFPIVNPDFYKECYYLCFGIEAFGWAYILNRKGEYQMYRPQRFYETNTDKSKRNS